MIRLEPHAAGTILPIRVQAGARRNEIGPPQDGELRVRVTQAPEKGKANQAILALLGKRLSVRKSQMELVSGETSRQKRILFLGLTVEELGAKIREATTDMPNN